MLDILRPLAVFSVVAETGSFRAAADRLGLSPSVVSHHVTKLEERFDIALLYRSTRQLTLTPAGQAVLSHARQVVDGGSDALDALMLDPVRPQGQLKVAAPAILEHGRFMDDVARFLALYPDVGLQLHFSDERVDVIGEGYDLALRAGALEDSSLMSQRLATADDELFAAPSYIAEAGEPERPEDLVRFRIIGVPSVSGALTFTHRETPERVVELRLAPAVRVNTGDGALSLVLRGAGIARLPQLLVEDGAGRDLVRILPDWTLPRFDVFAIWPRNAGRRSLTRLFVAHIQQELRRKTVSVGGAARG